MRIVYAGSPEISSIPLKGLIESGKHEIVAVLTNPPSMKGRKGELVPTPVETVAREAGLENIFTPEHLDAQAREQIASLNPDILVCFAYGKIFGPKFMALFPKGGINLHPSLLPLYRGCAPVPASILNMDSESGITIQTVAQEMDAGDILLQTRFDIEENDNSETVLNRVSQEGAELFLKVLSDIESGNAKCIKQDSSKATYCEMLKKEDGLIDWNDSAEKICAKVRAFYPWPGAFTYSNGTLLKIHQSCVYKSEITGEFENGTVISSDKQSGILIKCGKGILSVQNLQMQGKKAMNWKDFLNGAKNFIGSVCKEI